MVSESTFTRPQAAMLLRRLRDKPRESREELAAAVRVAGVVDRVDADAQVADAARVRPPPRRGSQAWCMVDAGNRPTPPARARHQAMNRTTVYRVHPGPLRWAQFLAHIAGTRRYQWNWAIERLQDAMRTEREGRGEKPSINSSRLGLEFAEALGPGFQS